MRKLAFVGLVLGAAALWLLSTRAPGRGDANRSTSAEAAPAPAEHTELATPLMPASRAAESQREEALQIEASAPSAVTSAEASAEDPPMIAFHGVVRDALSGAPIPGARAFIARARGEPATELSSSGIDASPSDAAGRFKLSFSSQRRLAGGQLEAEGYGAVTFVLDQEHGTPERAEVVELLSAATLEVHVTDTLGKGLDKVAVELVRYATAPAFRSGAVLMPDRQHWYAHTDASGIARLAGLSAEVVLGWTVRQSAGSRWREGRLALAPGEVRRIDVVLGGSARVSGRVRDEFDAAVPDLPLFLAPESNGTHHGDSQRVLETKSDSSGAFEFIDVSYDTYRLGNRPAAQGFLELDEALVVDQERIERELKLTRGLFLSGRIVGAQTGLNDLTSAVALSHEGTLVAVGNIKDLAFRLGPMLPGAYLVGAGDGETGTEVVPARAGDSDIELHVVTPVEVIVRVKSVEGRVDVSLVDLERAFSTSWNAGSSPFTLELVPGAYALWVTTVGGLVGFVPRFVVPARGSPEEIVLDLRTGAHCTLVHAASEGRRSLRLLVGGGALPMEWVFNHAYELYPGASQSVLLPAGPVSAELVEDGRVVAREEVLLAPGERRRIVLAPR